MTNERDTEDEDLHIYEDVDVDEVVQYTDNYILELEKKAFGL